MKRNRTVAVGLLMAMTCLSRTSMAAGGNLVPNGTFDTDLRRWCGQSANSSWSLFSPQGELMVESRGARTKNKLARLEPVRRWTRGGRRAARLILCTSVVLYLTALPAWDAHAQPEANTRSDCEKAFEEGLKEFAKCQEKWACTDCCSSWYPAPCTAATTKPVCGADTLADVLSAMASCDATKELMPRAEQENGGALALVCASESAWNPEVGSMYVPKDVAGIGESARIEIGEVTDRCGMLRRIIMETSNATEATGFARIHREASAGNMDSDTYLRAIYGLEFNGVQRVREAMALCGEEWGSCSLANQPTYMQAGDFEAFYEGKKDTEHFHWNRGEYDSNYRHKYEAKQRQK